ncbi:MAG: 4Fe-4S binding protein [Coriobacteriales bacterium]|nr:4Fe-4S binding protein [Coriobacteriales bacterium]
MACIFVVVFLSLALDTGFGTPSAVGIGEFFLLCPLGGLEALLAAKVLLPTTLLSLAIVIVLIIFLGRAWCSWGCPVPPLQRFFLRSGSKNAPLCDKADSNLDCNLDCNSNLNSDCKSGLNPDHNLNRNLSCSLGGQKKIIISRKANCNAKCNANCNAKNNEKPHRQSVEQTVTKKTTPLLRLLLLARTDSRILVLAVVLFVTIALGFPVFCLICPIGLIFGTVISVWRLFVFKQMTLSLLVFPLCLCLELVLYKKWCMRLCPVAALLTMLGCISRFLWPKIESSKCLTLKNKEHADSCLKCVTACPEGINLHMQDLSSLLRKCTRCGECLRACPTQAVRFGRCNKT